MTVKELIEILKTMPQDKRVEIGTAYESIGELKFVQNYRDCVELEIEGG